MNPLLSDFLSLVGLIATYKQLTDARKSSAKADSVAKFQTWLIHAGLNEIASKIEASAELQDALTDLLSQRHSEITTKLEAIEDVVRSVASRMEGFSAIASALPHEEYLSDQACDFLVTLDATSTGEVLCHMDAREQTIAFLSEGAGSYNPPEPRFFGDDVDKLQAAGWIKVARFNKSGQPHFAITRRGSAAAKRFCNKSSEETHT